MTMQRIIPSTRRLLMVMALALLASVLPLTSAVGQAPTARSLLNVPFKGVATPGPTFDLVQSVVDFGPGATSHVISTGTAHYLSVLDGDLTVSVDGKAEVVGAGKGMSVPAGTKLILSNAGTAQTARLFAATLLSVGAVTDVDGVNTGNLEIWPSNYGTGFGLPDIGGSSSAFDFNDNGGNSTSIGHGSFQTHNWGAQQVLFSISHCGSRDNDLGVGIGNDPNPPADKTTAYDYTWTYNAGLFDIRDLYVFVRTAANPDDIGRLLADADVNLAAGAVLDLNASTQTVRTVTGSVRLLIMVMVGGMTAESAMKEMRRLNRKAMITGGDRSDMLLAALSTDTSCLILTGGLYPDNHVLAKAEELQVPVLLVGHGTQVAADMFENLIARIDPSDTAKVDMVAEMVRRHVDLTKVWGD